MSSFLSKTEIAYFNALAEHDTIKSAAQSIGVDPQTVYNWIYHQKMKYRKRRGWINAVLSQRRRSELLSKSFTEKVELQQPSSEEDKEA